MNFRVVIQQLGFLLMVLSAFLLGVAAWAGLQLGLGDQAEEQALYALLGGAACGAVVGGFSYLLAHVDKQTIGRRESLLLVTLSWLLAAALSALPFFLWAHMATDAASSHPFRSPVNCYFEATSGLTTTGATVLTDIAGLPRSLHLWRAMTHWLGGLGIVVLFVAVLPSLGVGGKRLYRVEAPGPSPEGVHPHIRDTARTLWVIYLTLTVVEIVALRVAGMGWFESTCHTFGTLATGGFSTRNASVGEYDSAAIHWILIFFMVLAGVNFGLYYQLFRGKVRSVLRDSELRLYLALLLGCSAVVCASIYAQPIVSTTGQPLEQSVGEAVRQGVFTTVSIQTTTGFCTSDFNTWPFLGRGILVLLMFVGGSAGSTSGGIKVIRIWIGFKVLRAEIERLFRPHVVRPLKVGGAVVDSDLQLTTLAYIIGTVVLFTLGAGLIMLLEPADHGCDFTTAATASLATLCTIGPGLGKVGAIENFGWMTDPSKLVLSLWMLLGRLELFPIIVLFSSRFWSDD